MSRQVSLRNIALLLLLVVAFGLKIMRTAANEANEANAERAAAAADESARVAAQEAAQTEEAELAPAKAIVREALLAAQQRRWDAYRSAFAEGALVVGPGLAMWEQPPLEAFEIVSASLNRTFGGVVHVVVHENIERGQAPTEARTFEHTVINGKLTKRAAPLARINEATALLEQPFRTWAASVMQRVRLTAVMREELSTEDCQPLSFALRPLRGGAVQVPPHVVFDSSVSYRALRAAFRAPRFSFANDDQRRAWDLLADSGEGFHIPWPVPPSGG